jgi:hypothetical protein
VGFPDEPSPRNQRDNPPRSRQFRCKKCFSGLCLQTTFEFDWNHSPTLSIPMLQRTLPAGFTAPCIPTKTDKLPSGSQWLHEIKHDGFRVIARKDGPRVRLYIVDGEAVACDDNGVASFDLIRHHRANGSVFLFAFDLIELNGDAVAARSAGGAQGRARV